MRSVLLWICVAIACGVDAAAQTVEQLKVGQWAELKGGLDASGRFVVEAVEVLAPDDTEELIGTVTEVDTRASTFRVLGQRISASVRTVWKDAELGSIKGKRVKVQGHYRGTSKFSARTVSARGAGNDRIVGRIDYLAVQAGGRACRVMGFDAWIPDAVGFENKGSLEAIALAPLVEFETSAERARDSDEFIPGSYRLAEDLYLGGLLDWKSEHRDNFDLDSKSASDVSSTRMSVRAQLLWTPSESFTGLFSPRYEVSWRKDQRFPEENKGNPGVQELWGYWRGVGGSTIDLQFGRQLFRDKREWLYKAELDGLRAIGRWDRLRVEASATTVLSDGSERDEHSEDMMLYVSNNDELQHLAAYVIDRRDPRHPRDYPLHLGARAYGSWIPNNESWLEGAVVRGYTGDVDLRGYAFDIGTTWTPWSTVPVYLTGGFAYGSGDDPASTRSNESFRQTGFQRNNGKFGGVTSFRYYGELLDPELSNLSILTLGIGARVARRTSLDLVWHAFDQADGASTLFNAGLKTDPDGVHRSIGHELDIVFGNKSFDGFDFELVAGWFDPGAAFPNADEAWMASFQVRYRF